MRYQLPLIVRELGDFGRAGNHSGNYPFAGDMERAQVDPLTDLGAAALAERHVACQATTYWLVAQVRGKVPTRADHARLSRVVPEHRPPIRHQFIGIHEWSLPRPERHLDVLAWVLPLAPHPVNDSPVLPGHEYVAPGFEDVGVLETRLSIRQGAGAGDDVEVLHPPFATSNSTSAWQGTRSAPVA